MGRPFVMERNNMSKKLEQLLINNKIITRTVTGDTFLLTEEFLGLLEDKLVKSDCIINHLPSYNLSAKKVYIPVLTEMTYTEDVDGNISNNIDTGMSVQMAVDELKTIDLRLAFSSSIFDLQGKSVKDYVADAMVEYMVGAIHTQLKSKLIAAGCGQQFETYTDTWFKKFVKSHVNKNSVVLMSSDMIGMIKGIDIQQEFKLLGVEPIITDDANFHGVIVVGKNDIVHVHDGQVENRVLDEVGFLSNLTYFNVRYWSGFVIKRPDRCYAVTFQD